ncbi:MAG: hypothetical protein ACKVT0_00800 [Planctomycetaceae bacterium]
MMTVAIAGCYCLCGWYGGFSQSDPYYGAVKVAAYSFESDQDKDFDNIPDDWVRRKGEGYPTYVEAKIDRQHGRDGRQSLRFDVNGGKTVMYSDVIRIDPDFSYVFQGYIRTQRLQHNAAIYSISFLNHKRQRVQRYVSQPVGGTHKDWVQIRIDAMVPQPDVRFAVIGCHLLHGDKMDITGTVWFDDVWFGRLPQLRLVSNFSTHFRHRDAPINITSHISGLDAERRYELHLMMFNNADQLLHEVRKPLQIKTPPPDAQAEAEIAAGAEPVQRRLIDTWELGSLQYGFYRVQSTLMREGEPILRKQTTFAVMDLVKEEGHGEFGWTISKGVTDLPLSELSAAVSQAGINWIKYPLWQTVFDPDPLRASQLSQLFKTMQDEGINTVGLLDDPPHDLRSKFAAEWLGISEIFSLPPSLWSPSIIQVMARYSSQVRHWQLGGEQDYSFIGMSQLPEILSTVKHEMDRVGRDSLVGLSWNWDSPLPAPGTLRNGFLSISSSSELAPEALLPKLQQSIGLGIPRWVLIRPQDKTADMSKSDLAARNADLIKRMLYAKIGGADAIFVDDVFDEQHGLINQDGSPTLLFLPWRTAALALRGAEFLGSFNLPGGSTNFVFARDSEAIVVLWSDEPVKENLALGEAAVAFDVWGMKQELITSPGTSNQEIEVTSLPIVIRHCSGPLARLIMGVRFERGQLASKTTSQEDAIIGLNTFEQGISGQVHFNIPKEHNGKEKDWELDPHEGWKLQVGAGEKFRLPLRLTLPPNTGLGRENISIDFDIVADRTYRFRVYHNYQVGLGDVTMRVVERFSDDNRVEIEQIITNNTSPPEILDFSCSLFIPGERRQKKLVARLAVGQDKKYFTLPNADQLKGKELWIRAEQVGGSRILNFRWIIGDNVEVADPEQLRPGQTDGDEPLSKSAGNPQSDSAAISR